MEDINIYKVYPNHQKTVCIDFDGTLNYWAYPELGEPQPYVSEALQKLKDIGFRIIISSCRTNLDLKGEREATRQVEVMADYLKQHNIPFDEIDNGKQGKVVADIYIDDRAIAFSPRRGRDWKYIVKEISEQTVENETT